MCYGNLNNKMKFIQRYKSPKFIGIGDKIFSLYDTYREVN